MRRIFLMASAALLMAFAASLFVPLDRKLFQPYRTTSLRIVDRHGMLLREVLSEAEGRGRWCSLTEISPNLINAVIAAEDARFYSHPGVDVLAVLRAAWQNMRASRVVSGGSTLTMQVIRSVYPFRRSLLGKIREAWFALRLERMMTKDEILTHYLNRVPFGNQTFGVDAAARLYFGKPPAQLSVAEAAFLAAIPNSPARNDPYSRFDRVRARQLYVLKRMQLTGYISEDERERAEQETMVLVPRSATFKAPHFTTMLLQRLPAGERGRLEEVSTTLDYPLQKTAEAMVQAHLRRLRKHNVTNAAVVIIANKEHELRVLVGSRDFFDSTTNGQVNGALALRQPGSTLKPFTYGLAVEHGMTAADLLADIPRLNGDSDVDFLPENYDRRFHGPVRMRVALACSYNVPAVRLVERFGEEFLLRTLHAAGFVSLNKPASFYGVGLTLGNGEVTLLELANAYSALANGGMYVPLKMIDSVRMVGQTMRSPARLQSLLAIGKQDSSVVFSPEVVSILTDILSDANARAAAFGAHSSLNLPFPCAAKTGTSKDYRDNWTVGYTKRFTVGVWVGNFTAEPMKLVSGITGAAPLFRDLMLYLHRADDPELAFARPAGITTQRICPRSGMKPGKHCPGEVEEVFLAGSEPKQRCSVHRLLRIDTRTGALASSETPHAFVAEQVFEIFRPEFERWMEKQGMPRPPDALQGRSDNIPQPQRARAPLAISIPSNGEVFTVDPILRPQYQTITVESVVAQDVRDVMLCINGKEVASLVPPYRYRLPLAALNKGSLTLVVKGKKGVRVVESAPVRIAVR